ncbi:hypothetical protein HUK38_14380, partial [Thiospirillum jenense]|nr:hypothetical protein [Thiospirillum jenense]
MSVQFIPRRHKLAIAIALALGSSHVLAADPVDCNVTIESDNGLGDIAYTLSWAIKTANNAETPTTVYTGAHPGGGCKKNIITLSTDVTIAGVMKRLINSSVTIQGNKTIWTPPATCTTPPCSSTISGGDTYRPLFIKSGTVTIENVNFDSGKAQGGDGNGGGGGAGLGGAIFIYDGNVTLKTVGFSSNNATGGKGGDGAGVMGGGGMFGNSYGGGGGLF